MTVALGTSALFIFNGFNVGVMNQYRENTIHARYGNGQINLKGYRDKVHEKPWEHWMTNYAELAQKLKATPNVKHVFPRVEFFALLTNGRVTVSGRGQGVDGAEESKFFTTLNVEQGATLAAQPDGILLGQGLARALDAKPGDRITVLANTIHGSMNGVDLVVTGIFHTGSKDFDDVVFRLPLAQSSLLLDTPHIESVAIGLDRIEDWPAIAAAVLQSFPELEATPFEILDKVYYQHSVDWLNAQYGILQSIILFIVILGIINTVSIGILERKHEIGNLRANGESVQDVMKLLMLEGVVLGIAGGLLGVGLAWFLNFAFMRGGILMPPAPGITRVFRVLIELQPDMALKTFLMGALTASLGTVIAGSKVARMPIADALRST